jgi:DNA invertase Pin-like site-specific DNA recombinase
VRNTRDALDLAELMKAKGVALHSISEKLDTTSAMGSFFFTIMSALAELERRQIGERTSIALRHKRMVGEKTGGAVPYGWEAVPGDTVRLSPVPQEQAVIEQVLARRKQGESLRSICAWLNSSAIPAKQGGAWGPGALGRLIKGVRQAAA